MSEGRLGEGGAIRWVIFDWGDVLVRYRPQGFVCLAQRLSTGVEEVVAAIQRQGLFQALLIGRAAPEEMSARIEQVFGRQLSRADIAACFAGDVKEPMPGMFELVEVLSARSVQLAMLSNTFFGHWDHLLRDPAYAPFAVPLASHVLGAAKPQRTIYRCALAELDARPEEVVFWDDQQGHVDAARACGWQAYRFESAAQVKRRLAELGVL